MKKAIVFVIVVTFVLVTLLIYFFNTRDGRLRPLKEDSPVLGVEDVSKSPLERFFIKKEGKAPSFTLTNQDGKKVSLKDFRGKVVVMTYIYTTCIYACPLLEAKLLDVQHTFRDRLGRDLILVSLTMDPERDTPMVMRQHAENLGADLRGWVFLTGSKREIKKVLKSYGFSYKKREDGHFNHENRYTIINREGDYAYEVNGQLPNTDPLIWKLIGLLEGME